MPPEGRFVDRGGDRIVLIAAGSGITPMVSIAAAALARGAEVTLIYGNRTTGSIMFRSALEALKDRYLDRFSLIHVLSREPQDVALLNGRIDAEKIAALQDAGLVRFETADGIYLCGPGAMIDTVADALGRTCDPDRIHFERFTQEGEPPRAPSDAAISAAATGATIEVILDGVTRQFPLGTTDASVLEAAARAGLELPYSCKGGMCCTCRCKVVAGQSEMALNYALEPWETEQGFTLACQTRPTSDRLVLDFDAT